MAVFLQFRSFCITTVSLGYPLSHGRLCLLVTNHHKEAVWRRPRDKSQTVSNGQASVSIFPRITPH